MAPNNLLHFLSPNSRLPCDVIFEVLPSPTSIPVSIPAHKCFLANASLVFDEMFFQSGKARETGKDVTVQITNKSEDVFRMFLNHLYGKEVVVEELASLESMIEMFQLAEQYSIEELHNSLLERIKLQSLEKENLLSVVNLVKEIGECSAKDDLEIMLFKYVKANAGECVIKLATFMFEQNAEAGIPTLLMKLAADRLEYEGSLVESVQLTSIEVKTDIIYEFLQFSNFPQDKMKEMVDKFTNSLRDV